RAALRCAAPSGAARVAATHLREGPAAARVAAAEIGAAEGGAGRHGPFRSGAVTRPACPRHLAAGRTRRRPVRPGEGEQPGAAPGPPAAADWRPAAPPCFDQSRSEEHTSELQSLTNLVCRLLLEKKKKTSNQLSHTQKA